MTARLPFIYPFAIVALAFTQWGCGAKHIAPSQLDEVSGGRSSVLSAKQTAAELYDTGVDVYRSDPTNPQNRAEAEKLLTEALKSDPELIDAYLLLGTIYQDTGRFDESIENYKKGLEKNPKANKLTHDRAIAERRAGNQGRAKDLIEKLLKENPDDYRARNSLSVIYIDDGSHEKAIAEIREVLKTEENFVPAINNLGVIYLRTNRTALAELILLNALKQAPKSSEVNCNLGVVYSRLDEPTKAVRHFRVALENQPNWWLPSMALGALYLKYHDYNDAIANFSRVISLRPDNLAARVGLANALANQGKATEAKLVLEAILKKDSAHPYAIFTMGVIYFDQIKNPQLGADYIRKYISLGSRVVPAHLVEIYRAKVSAWEDEVVASQPEKLPPLPAKGTEPATGGAKPAAAPSPAKAPAAAKPTDAYEEGLEFDTEEEP